MIASRAAYVDAISAIVVTSFPTDERALRAKAGAVSSSNATV